MFLTRENEGVKWPLLFGLTTWTVFKLTNLLCLLYFVLKEVLYDLNMKQVRLFPKKCVGCFTIKQKKKILKSLLKDKLKRNFGKNLFEVVVFTFWTVGTGNSSTINWIPQSSKKKTECTLVRLLFANSWKKKNLYHHNRFILTNSKQPPANLLKKLLDSSNNSQHNHFWFRVSNKDGDSSVFAGSELITS